MADSTDNKGKKSYDFGGINDFNLEEIENEVLNDSVYLDVFAGSDVRFKENVQGVENALEQIMKLNAYTYNYKTEEFPNNNFPSGEQTGLMAQDVEKVAPIAVKEDSEGMKYVNYARLAPLLIESVKELQKTVEAQAKKIAELETKLKK
jgi:hypothetical protein